MNRWLKFLFTKNKTHIHICKIEKTKNKKEALQFEENSPTHLSQSVAKMSGGWLWGRGYIHQTNEHWPMDLLLFQGRWHVGGKANTKTRAHSYYSLLYMEVSSFERQIQRWTILQRFEQTIEEEMRRKFEEERWGAAENINLG